jgi:hypothetical protein
VPLIVDGQTYDHWFYVPSALPKSFAPLVLGLDFLQGKATIDFVRGFVFFKPSPASAFSARVNSWSDLLTEHLMLAERSISDPVVLRDVKEAMVNQAVRNKDTWKGCSFPPFVVNLHTDQPFSRAPYKYPAAQQEFIARKLGGWAAKGLGFPNH